jgi:hypothetical protein
MEHDEELKEKTATSMFFLGGFNLQTTLQPQPAQPCPQSVIRGCSILLSACTAQAPACMATGPWLQPCGRPPALLSGDPILAPTS